MASETDPKSPDEPRDLVRDLTDPGRVSSALRERDKIAARRRGRRIWGDQRDRILSA
ncbi:hypothetical protein [Brevundimonas sp.]|jgi:hypothetical protein|uniref:hypothetical protein n=1 Tax=Brevundimonas sp. TaxID=1871086 RepID=UPI0037C0C903